MEILTSQELTELLMLPEHLEVQAIFPSPTHLTIHVTGTAESASCPQCQTPSQRIHGKYSRTLADLPWAGRRVIRRLTVRKFVCRVPTCPCQIFTERLPKLTQPYARMTNRLRTALQTLGLATSGEAGARVCEHLGMPVTAAALIRSLRLVAVASASTVRVVGIDDWCWKKGRTYGTLVVDLERRKPIEVLADRKAETVEAWLRSHPEIQVVSRDWGGEYAAAARRGAPQAQQVADPFHLLLNLREKMKDLMTRKQKVLPYGETITSQAVAAKAQEETVSSCPLEDARSFRQMSADLRIFPSRDTSAVPKETPAQISRSNRYARSEAVRALHTQGVSCREMARRLKMAREIVRKFLAAETFPEQAVSAPKPSILDPYTPYLRERWEAGCQNGTQLCAEIKQRGSTGSESLCRLFITNLRKRQPAGAPASPPERSASDPAASSHPPSQRRLSPAKASWLCVNPADQLDEPQRQQIERLQAAHPDLATAYRLSQAFVTMLKEHRGQDLDAWLLQAKQSGLRERKSFAQGIRRDSAAVRAAFPSEWRNGQVEAQVNCLKLQKRIGFGRANFDLLRLRVLCRA